MAGMEQIEIHSRNYLLRWVNAKPSHTISWTIQPHKRSINFGLFKHPGALAGLPSVAGLPPLSATSSRTDENPEEEVPEVVEKLAGIGLKQVVKLGKCEADKFSQGRYEIPPREAGNYALVFDNTFSKSLSKTVTFFLLTYPTSTQSQISFGAQLHHSSAMTSAMAMAPPVTGRRSPKLSAKGKQSVDSLNQAARKVSTTPTVPASSPMSEETAFIHTGILQKRRRKRHQGFARRFFCLDYTSATLSYYHDRNSSALRGAIPLSLAAIGANPKTREISIDSGAEIWHLKANNNADFDEWRNALEKASRLIVESTAPGTGLSIDTHLESAGSPGTAQAQEWARLETLLGKISGTRDAVRRLCLETLASPIPPPSPQFDGTSLTPTDGANDGYFPMDERRAFWKRKPSSTNVNSNIFKRSVSAQLIVPTSGTDSTSRSGNSTPRRHHSHEEGMHDHMKALLQNLDQVVQEFAMLVNENKQRRTPDPKSAVSRLSYQSVESQEFFDAEDQTLSRSDSRLLAIQDDDGDDYEGEDRGYADSASSSDIDDSPSVLSPGRAFRSGSLSSLIPPKAKSLSPLPLNPVKRRNTVKAPTIMPPSLIGFLRKNVGKDLSTISMPVSANEPTSLLQRAAENLEYSNLLDKAAMCGDQQERMIYVTAFAISGLSNARVKERSIRKPFNPMLGETYELVREDLNFRLVAEKVSHRPVQLAYHAESSEWAFTQSPLPSQKFWGKSSEIVTEGKARLVLHGSTGGECLSWSTATCFLRNILAGEKYVEPVGTMTVLNETTGWKAVISFKAKGMFSGRSEDVEAQLFDETGAEQPLGLVGTWTSNLMLKENGRFGKEIWRAGSLVERPDKHYGMTLFAAGLNEITDVEKGKLPPTDSRLRSDQRALENGNHEEAERLKNLIEEGQRRRRRDMEANEEEWEPKFFTKVKNGDEIVWKLKTNKEDSYWERRAKGDWNGIVDVLSTE